MLPSFFKENGGYIRRGYFIMSSYTYLRFSFRNPLKNIPNIRFLELAVCVFFSLTGFSMLYRISTISFISVPSQIYEIIVGRVSVIMTTAHSSWLQSYKRFENRSMNLFMVVFPIFAKFYNRIASTYKWSNNFGKSSCAFPSSIFPTSYISKITNLIKREIIDWFEYFSSHWLVSKSVWVSLTGQHGTDFSGATLVSYKYTKLLPVLEIL